MARPGPFAGAATVDVRNAVFPCGAALEVVAAIAAALVVVGTASTSVVAGGAHSAEWRRWLALAAVLVFYHGLVRVAWWLRRRTL